jgi:hypothetical protein
MPGHLAAVLLGVLPVLLVAAGCLKLAFHLARVESPSYPACVGWVLLMGFAARGGSLVVRNHVAPSLGEGAGLEIALLHAASYALIPFFALRLLVCSETIDALRVHALNLIFTGLLALAVFVAHQELA